MAKRPESLSAQSDLRLLETRRRKRANRSIIEIDEPADRSPRQRIREIFPGKLISGSESEVVRKDDWWCLPSGGAAVRPESPGLSNEEDSRSRR